MVNNDGYHAIIYLIFDVGQLNNHNLARIIKLLYVEQITRVIHKV